MQQINLNQLLNKTEIKHIFSLIKKKEYIKAKLFLRGKKEYLEGKGIIPDYLFYFLQYQIEVRKIQY